MSAIKIPVSFEFFKKYTYHEEWVEMMLKAKAKGHPKTYEALMKSNECKERALRSYYEAFYLNPKIREKYHIRFKAVPKKIKDKLLIIPVEGTSEVNEKLAIDDNKNVTECPMQDVINCLDRSHKSDSEVNAKGEEYKKRILKAANYDNEEDEMVEDDSEVLSSPEICATTKEINDENNSSVKIQSSAELIKSPSKSSKETVNYSSRENNNNNEVSHPASPKEQQNNTELEISSPTATNKKPKVNYKDLVCYIHCCPLTYKEFRKYSNINQLVKEYCESHHLEASKQPMILNKVYILFYLAPEHRNIPLINKIQLIDNCPLEIKNKFFTIPTKLYLKEKEDLNKTQENLTQNPFGMETNATSRDKQTTNSPVIEPKTKNKVEQIINSAPTIQITEQSALANCQEENNKENQNLTIPISRSETKNLESSEKLSNATHQTTMPTPSNEPTIAPALNIPVSLDEFKKYTHFEEIVDELFKKKSQDNEELFCQYKNSREAFDLTLNNYYRAFYLVPYVREIFPIRFKALPSFVKKRLLQIPDGVNVEAMHDFRMEQLVAPDFDCTAAGGMQTAASAGSVIEKENLREQEALSSPGISVTPKEANDKANSPVKMQSNIEPIASPSKPSKETVNNSSRENNNNNEVNHPTSPKVQQTNTASPPAATNKKPKVNYKDLVRYIHCCPLTYKEFLKYSNINQLVKEFCEKQHLEASKQRMILNKVYILLYLAPEHRNIPLINKIQLIDNCPLEIRNKFFTIPTKLYLKGEEDLNKAQENLIHKPIGMETNATRRDQQITMSPVKKRNTKNKAEQIINSALTSQITEESALANCQERKNKENPKFIIPIPRNKTTKPESPEKLNQTTIHTPSNEATIAPALNIPVSLNEFKKYTYFEEIVDKLFQKKSRDNDELFCQYKNSREAFDLTLNNYYRAFYLVPYVREIFPIRFKALPSFVKKRLLQIPDGVNVEAMHDFRIEQLVAPDFDCTAAGGMQTAASAGSVIEKENLGEQEAANNSFSSFSTNSSFITIKTGKDVESSDSDNKTKSPKTAVKRTPKDDMKSFSPKRQKMQKQPTQTIQSYSENIENIKKSYKDLLLYAHCCPVTYSEFKTYTNITELFSGYCQKRYNSVKKLPYMLNRAYVLFYLAPENRNFKPLNKFKILPKCPQHLRDRMYEIPTNLYLKGEKTNVVTAERQAEIETQPKKKQEVLEKTKELKETEQQIQETVIEQQQQVCSKGTVEILEHRLLAPKTLSFISQSSTSTASSTTQPTENLMKNSQNQQQTTEKHSTDLWKSMRNDKIFAKFRCKLLFKLNQSLDKSVDFSSETYEIFLQCNEIPLKQLLNNFCDNNEDIVLHILNDQELCEVLKRYYYSKYLTNSNFALKYPAKLKQKTLQENNLQTSMKKEIEKDKTNSETPNRSQKQQENFDDKTPNYKILEKAKRVFFRNVEKTNSLSYILRTTVGLKQLILQTVLSLTFEEFIEITNIYEGYQLYVDNHIAECMYRYVFRTPLVWPTNLYISLKNLCEFLHKKNIRFNDYSTMLKYISPKILHWSALLSCTNIIDCVKIYYENRTGKSLNGNISLKDECIKYYNRCWKQEKWLGAIPIVYEEFYKEYMNTNDPGDVNMLDESDLQEICEEPSVAENNIVANEDTSDVTILDESDLEEICEEQTVAENNNLAIKDTDDISFTEREVCQQTTVSNLNTNAARETEVNVETKEEMNTLTNDNQSFNEFNCIILPNTQQQIEMLPAEIRVSDDPLNNIKSTLNLSVSSTTSESSDEVISVGELALPIKTEPTNIRLLNNLIFYEDEDSNMQCTPFEDEIVELDTTETEVFENLPPSQMDFENVTPEIILSNDLANSDNSNGLLNLGQRIPSSSESNDDNVCSQQLMQQQQNISITSTQLRQFPDVTLRSSGEDESPKNVEENQHQGEKNPNTVMEKQLGSLQSLSGTSTISLQSFITYPEAQRFPSTFEDIQTYSGDVNAEVESNPLQQEENYSTTTENSTKEFVSVPMVTIEVQQPFNNNDDTTSLQVIQPSNTANEALPLRRCISRSCAIVKSLKNVAKVRPLKNSDYVPQIQHNTRPLLTKPAYIANSCSKDNKEQQAMIRNTSDSAESPPAIQMPNSTTTPAETNSINSFSQPMQNSSLQLQLSPLGTHIFFSQELNTNCSVFNNSSLLRIVDNNYHKKTSSTNLLETSTTLIPIEENTVNSETPETQEQQPATSLTIQQPAQRVTYGSSVKTNNAQQVIANPTTNEINQPASLRRVTRRTSLYKDTNDKVNNIPLTLTNNPIAAIAPTIHYHHPYKMVHKLCLYRDLIKFHYFKNLTSQHITKYLLPSVEFGKSYTEATIVCEQFKTRISNRSISALFSFWPQKLQRDFLLVLSDLKEFHYVAFERTAMQSKEDLRARVLFWLLNTAPLFSLCLLTCESNNTEFAHCERITNGNNPSYKRKPFKCLTNALNMRVLDKLRDMKRDLRGKS